MNEFSDKQLANLNESIEIPKKEEEKDKPEEGLGEFGELQRFDSQQTPLLKDKSDGKKTEDDPSIENIEKIEEKPAEEETKSLEEEQELKSTDSEILEEESSAWALVAQKIVKLGKSWK